MSKYKRATCGEAEVDIRFYEIVEHAQGAGELSELTTHFLVRAIAHMQGAIDRNPVFWRSPTGSSLRAALRVCELELDDRFQALEDRVEDLETASLAGSDT